jgi:DNA-binding SARP family transcriptional activator
MYRLRLLGAISLTDERGNEPRALLAQPKRLALLAYLAITGGFQRRDLLLGIFWPELDASHARGALSQALRFIRRELGDSEENPVILSRGAEEVGINPQMLSCDVTAFEEAAKSDRHDEAVALYEGHLLDGFFINGGGPFDDWLDRTRERLRSTAALATRSASERHEASGDHAQALALARRGIELSYPDERALRELLGRLYRLGDRGGALQAYESFAERLREDFDSAPSAQTLGVVEHIRVEAPRPIPEALAAERSEYEALTRRLPPARRPTTRRRTILAAVAVLLIVSATTYAGVTAGGSDPRLPVEVQPFQNKTGDPRFDYAGRIVEADLTRALDGVPNLRRAGRGAKRRYTVSASYHRNGDSLDFVVEIFDHGRSRALPPLAPIRVDANTPLDAGAPVRHAAFGALGYYTSVFGSEQSSVNHVPLYPAFLQFSEGLEARLRFDVSLAEASFRRAIAEDPRYTEAYFLLGSTLISNPGPASRYGGSPGQFDVLDSIAKVMRETITDPTPADRLTAQFLAAYGQGKMDSALAAVVQLGDYIAAANFAAGYMGATANDPLPGIAALERLNPDEGWIRRWNPYWVQYAAAAHQSGDYRKELDVVQRWKKRYSESLLADRAEIRAKAGLGTIDDLPYRRLEPQGLVASALELRAHGHHAKARELFALAVERAPAKEGGAERTWLAMGLIGLGRLDEAEAKLKRSAQLDTMNLNYRGMLATVYAQQGKREKAMRISREIEMIEAPYLHGFTKLWRARIAARLGQRDSAVSLLRQAFADGLMYHTGYPQVGGTFWHSEIDFESLRGYPPFDSLLLRADLRR